MKSSILSGFILLIFAGCQGQISEKSPVHPNMNMDQQPRKEAQEANAFFEDNRSMRTPVEGTVARGLLKEDTAYYEGVDESGAWIATMPVELTKSFLYRGKDRYEVFCSACHGLVGDGKGIIMEGGYGYVPAPTYHQERLINAPDGELYSAIYNGVRTMPSYATQVPVEDRWAIVAYIRALQASHNVSKEEILAYGVDTDQLEAEFMGDQSRLQALAEAQRPANEPAPTAARGEQLYTTKTCFACHSTDGSPKIGPSFKGIWGKQEEVVDASGNRSTITVDEAYIRESIKEPNAKKVVGFENMVMTQFNLTDNEIQSLTEFIKSLADN